MASAKFPMSVADKQQALFVKPLPAGDLVALGRKYEQAGQLHDALDFYQAAQERPAVESLVAKAVETADLVLLLNACRAAGVEVSRQQFEALRNKALETGKGSVAKRVSILLAQAP
jgi:hypothetical protein